MLMKALIDSSCFARQTQFDGALFVPQIHLCVSKV